MPDERETQTSSERRSAESQSPDGLVRGSGHVLIVDDEETVCSFLAKALGHLGYNVSAISDPKAAVHRFRSEHATIDLVILDIVMPELSGAMVYEELKAIDPSVRVVIMSGYTRSGTVDKLLADGALAFLPKPYRLNELSKLLAEHVAAPR